MAVMYFLLQVNGVLERHMNVHSIQVFDYVSV